jgi:hypothetical protein
MAPLQSSTPAALRAARPARARRLPHLQLGAYLYARESDPLLARQS